MYYAIFEWSSAYEGEDVLVLQFPKWNEKIKELALQMVNEECLFYDCVAVICGELIENEYIYSSIESYVSGRKNLQPYADKLYEAFKN